MCFAFYFGISSSFKICVKSAKEWSRTAVRSSMHGIVKKSLPCIKNTALLEIWDGVDLQCFNFRKKIESTYQGRCNKFTSTLSLTDKVVSSTQIPARGADRGPNGVLSIFEWMKTSVFYKNTIMVCVRCSWRCPGTSAPIAAHLTVS